ncbi:helix-turn-helix transcriptional regulator [Nocardioides sp.]|uniref:helix-turn-helix transcriptional regulator n=1 Tax=Nocardioides sp. TaxID=35761 RepID=UPI002ED34C3F
MPVIQSPSVITALGFSKRVERDYHRLLAQSGRELVSVADSLLRTPEQLLHDVRGLVEAGIIRIEDARIHVATPPEAVALLLRETAAAAALANTRLEEVARALPHLAAPAARPRPGDVLDVRPIDGEISSGGNPVPLLRALITESAGDLCWLRPDDLGTKREQAMAAVVGQVIEQGRSSRAIYPARSWADSRETLELRASVGEHVRLLPELPTRMFIIGTTHVVLPEPLGFVDEPRSLVRQPGLVQALTLWFELLWERASPLPEAGRPSTDRAERDRFLLQQLARGARDEQIARTLGLSLRTVRRRVADLMADLGADSRFQAGVEAARRGWL